MDTEPNGDLHTLRITSTTSQTQDFKALSVWEGDEKGIGVTAEARVGAVDGCEKIYELKLLGGGGEGGNTDVSHVRGNGTLSIQEQKRKLKNGFGKIDACRELSSQVAGDVSSFSFNTKRPRVDQEGSRVEERRMRRGGQPNED